VRLPEQQQADVAAVVPDQTTTARVDAEPVTGNAGTSRPALQTPGVITASNTMDNAAPDNVNNTHPQKMLPIIQPAVYKELDTEDEKKSLYVGSLRDQ
jgi:hypothetical protein